MLAIIVVVVTSRRRKTLSNLSESGYRFSMQFFKCVMKRYTWILFGDGSLPGDRENFLPRNSLDSPVSVQKYQ